MQVFGNKAWTLIAPHHASELDVKEVTPFLHSTSREHPPLEKDLAQLTLEEGELLYIPAGWFHATKVWSTFLYPHVVSSCYTSGVSRF